MVAKTLFILFLLHMCGQRNRRRRLATVTFHTINTQHNRCWQFPLFIQVTKAPTSDVNDMAAAAAAHDW